MDSVLLIVEQPKGQSQDVKQRWLGFLEDTKDAIQASATQVNPTIETLGPNCWLIQLDTGVQDFAAFVYAAEGHGLHHRALFFKEQPDWVMRKGIAA
jgi:hypothetical protein